MQITVRMSSSGSSGSSSSGSSQPPAACHVTQKKNKKNNLDNKSRQKRGGEGEGGAAASVLARRSNVVCARPMCVRMYRLGLHPPSPLPYSAAYRPNVVSPAPTSSRSSCCGRSSCVCFASFVRKGNASHGVWRGTGREERARAEQHNPRSTAAQTNKVERKNEDATRKGRRSRDRANEK